MAVLIECVRVSPESMSDKKKRRKDSTFSKACPGIISLFMCCMPGHRKEIHLYILHCNAWTNVSGSHYNIINMVLTTRVVAFVACLTHITVGISKLAIHFVNGVKLYKISKTLF